MALRFRAGGVRVWGYDRDPAALAYALETGIIDEAASDLRVLCGLVEAVVLSAPVGAIIDILHQFAGPLNEQARGLRWIIDIASVKRPITEYGLALPNFLGTHPMAGSERQGPTAADPELFAGRPWVLVPTSSAGVLADVRAVVALMGAHALEVSAAEHDAIVAATSHLPQTLSSVLAAMLEPSRYQGLYGPGLRSMTRLASSPWSMWQSIYAMNADALLPELRSFAEHLASVIGALEQHNDQLLQALFLRAADHVERGGWGRDHKH